VTVELRATRASQNTAQIQITRKTAEKETEIPRNLTLCWRTRRGWNG